MRFATEMKGLLKQLLAGLLCAVLVATMMPIAPKVNADGDYPTNGVTVSIFKDYPNADNDWENDATFKDDYKLGETGSPEITSTDNLIYLVEFNDLSYVTGGADTDTYGDWYDIVLAGDDALLSVEKREDNLEAYSTDSSVTDPIKYGNVKWENGGNKIQVQFNSNKDSVTGGKFYIKCALSSGAGEDANDKKLI